MFGHFIDHAKLRLETVATHYGGRALVVLPIAVAAGFGIAAIYLIIEAQAGPILACVIMAGLFLIIAVAVAMAVLARERQQRLMLRQSAQQTAVMAGLMSAAPAVLSGGRRAAQRIGIGPVLLGSVVLAALFAARSRNTDAQS